MPPLFFILYLMVPMLFLSVYNFHIGRNFIFECFSHFRVNNMRHTAWFLPVFLLVVWWQYFFFPNVSLFSSLLYEVYRLLINIAQINSLYFTSSVVLVSHGLQILFFYSACLHYWGKIKNIEFVS